MRKIFLSLTLAFTVLLGSLPTVATAQDQPTVAAPATPQAQAQPTPQQLEWLYGVVWKKIANTYFDDATLRKNFDSWRTRYEGKLTTLAELDAALKAMVESLGDRYTRYTSLSEQKAGFEAHEGGSRHLGMPLTRRTDGSFAIEAIMYGSPAYGTALREGDVIKSINGKDLKGLTQAQADSMLLGKEHEKASVVALVQGKEITVELAFEETPDAGVKAALIDDGIAYVRLPDFVDPHTMVKFFAALSEVHKAANGNLKGIILDLRNNPGGVFDFAVGVASTFMERATVVKSTTRTDRMVTETAIKVVPVLPWFTQAMGKDNQALLDALQTKPMVVLVNGSTMSASEVVTGSFKDNGRATILGTTTYGKGVGYTEERLPNGAVLTITSLTYTTPNGYDLNGKGIPPNVVVEQPRDATTDVQLEEAVKFLQKTFADQRQQADDARQIAVQKHDVKKGERSEFAFYLTSGTGLVILLVIVLFVLARKRRRG